VFTFGFPRNGGNWAYDDLSYSSRIAREILFSGSDMKEGNSGSPLIKGDEVVGMVTSVTDFAHANSSAGIREFLQGAKGGSVVLEQMGKWGGNWRETYDKHLKETSMSAEQQRIAAEKATAAKVAEDKQKQLLAEQQRIAAEKATVAKVAEDKQKQLLAEQQHIEQQRIAAEKAAKEMEDRRKQQLAEQQRIAASDEIVEIPTPVVVAASDEIAETPAPIENYASFPVGGKQLKSSRGIGAAIGGMIGSTMDATDSMYAQSALENSPDEQPVVWHNSDTSVRYEITPTRTSSCGEHSYSCHITCRKYTIKAIINSRKDTVYGYACRQSDGTWQEERQ